MNKELIKRYVEHLNDALQYEDDPNEADILETKRDALMDILEGKNAYIAIEMLELTCPDENIVGDFECLGACDGFSGFCCEDCWRRILSI